MYSNQIVILVGALAAALAEGRTDDEIALLGAVLTQLGDSLATIAAARSLCGDVKNATEQQAQYPA